MLYLGYKFVLQLRITLKLQTTIQYKNWNIFQVIKVNPTVERTKLEFYCFQGIPVPFQIAKEHLFIAIYKYSAVYKNLSYSTPKFYFLH